MNTSEMLRAEVDRLRAELAEAKADREVWMRAGALLAWAHANDEEHDREQCPICRAERNAKEMRGDAHPFGLRKWNEREVKP